MNRGSRSMLLLAALTLATSALAADPGERAERRLDRRGDRIEYRLDILGDRIRQRAGWRSDRLDAHGHPFAAEAVWWRGARIDARLDRRGERIDARLDRRGDWIDRRYDRRYGG